MNERRTIALVLVAFMMAFGLVACGEDTTDEIQYVEDESALESLIGDSDAEKECPGPNPAGCVSQGCDRGEKCVTDTDVCVPSICGCNNGHWICTADCNGGICKPKEPVCNKPNPAGCTQEGCDSGETCVVDRTTCEPSHCECVGDDQWACSKDCGGGGVCEPWAPCEDMPCGKSCSDCPPDDPECVETTVIKACDGKGRCVPETPDLCVADEIGTD